MKSMNMQSQQQSITFNRQKGISLVMGLMFLVVLTILGVAGMRGALLEERMAGNTRDRDLAFQAAEAAIRVAEQALAAPPAFNLGTAYTPVLPSGAENAYWLNTHNWAAESVQIGWQPQGVSEAPRYVVERLALNGNGLNAGVPITVTAYRITARGVGMNANTVVILQTISYQS
jgi:type IV pilus assembly protein PilX